MIQKIVFFGSGWYTIPVIEKLITHGLDLVITTEKDPNSPFLKFCKENNIKTLTANTATELNNLKSIINDHEVAVLASYGAIIPQSIIDNFPNGILNIHPSLLPKYKGPSPIQYTLLNGETITGVTIIKLDNEVDHGPIVSQRPFNLTGNETSEDLLSILFEIGAELVAEQVSILENGEKLIETPQDHTQESWSYKIKKQDGYIDLNNLQSTIDNLQAMIKAYHPWPGVWLRYTPVIASNPSHPVIASKAKQSVLENKIIKFLPEGKIQIEGKNPMNFKDFINGFGDEGKELLLKLKLI